MEAGPPGDMECPRFNLGRYPSLTTPCPPSPQGGLGISPAPPTDWSLGPRVQACAAPTRGRHNPTKWTVCQSCMAPPHLHTDPILPVGKGREGTSRHLCIPQGELKTQRGACLARGHTANRCRAGTEPASMCQSGALPGSQGAGEPPAPYRVTQPPQAENADPPLPTFLPPPPLSAHLPLSATPCSSHGCCPAAPLFPDLGDSVVLLLHPVFDDADQRADVVELRFLQDPWHRQRPASLPLPPLPCSPLPPPPPPNPPPAPVTRG